MVAHEAKQSRGVGAVTSVLIFLLFLLPTIQYRVELGAFSFSVAEPLILIVGAFLLARQLFAERRLVLLNNPLPLLLLLLLGWMVVLRPWSSNFTNGLSDLRDWLLPVAVFVLLVSTVRSGWQRYAKFFLLIGVLQGGLAIYQALTNSARIFQTSGTALAKRGFLASPSGELPRASYGLGLFNHPNSIGYFLALQLLIWVGFFWSVRTRQKWLLLPIGALLGVALFLSYAKTSILAALILLPTLLLLRHRQLAPLIALLPLLGLLVSFVAFGVGYTVDVSTVHLPPELDTMVWRFQMWQDSVELLEQQPMILLVGNGDPALWELRGIDFTHPHNLPLYFIIYYGLPGLFFLVAFTLVLCKLGVENASLLRASPLLTALYLCVCTLPITGIVEALPNNLDSRMIYLNVCALFIGLLHEQKAARAQPLAERVAPAPAGAYDLRPLPQS